MSELLHVLEPSSDRRPQSLKATPPPVIIHSNRVSWERDAARISVDYILIVVATYDIYIYIVNLTYCATIIDKMDVVLLSTTNGSHAIGLIPDLSSRRNTLITG